MHDQRMIDETFETGVKITTQHKYLPQVLELAAEFDQLLPATDLNRSLYHNLINDGKGDLSRSVLFQSIKIRGYLENDK